GGRSLKLIKILQSHWYSLSKTWNMILISTAKGFTTASVPVTTASASISTVSPSRVSTAKDISGAETLMYIRRSAEKRKHKGKAIIKEDESI
ncbi:hypothetical protein Tco_0361525, partial [Tanacetum coccineum]